MNGKLIKHNIAIDGSKEEDEEKPRSSHLLNPEFGIDESDFRVSTQLEQWEEECNEKLFSQINKQFELEEAEGEDNANVEPNQIPEPMNGNIQAEAMIYSDTEEAHRNNFVSDYSDNEAVSVNNLNYNSDVQRDYESIDPRMYIQADSSDCDTIDSTVKSIGI